MKDIILLRSEVKTVFYVKYFKEKVQLIMASVLNDKMSCTRMFKLG